MPLPFQGLGLMMGRNLLLGARNKKCNVGKISSPFLPHDSTWAIKKERKYRKATYLFFKRFNILFWFSLDDGRHQKVSCSHGVYGYWSSEKQHTAILLISLCKSAKSNESCSANQQVLQKHCLLTIFECMVEDTKSFIHLLQENFWTV